MVRLTQKDEQGNWRLKGLAWEQLHVGQMITRETYEKLYGALWRLMEYEATGMDPEEIQQMLERTKKKDLLAGMPVWGASGL